MEMILEDLKMKGQRRFNMTDFEYEDICPKIGKLIVCNLKKQKYM